MREEVVLEEQLDKVILVGVDTGEEKDFEGSMKELQNLALACNKTVVGILTQKQPVINKAIYIGTGKAEELAEFVKMQDANEVIFDNALTPSQIRNLVKILDTNVSDRTNLILDIFSLRARTREAKLQVETAKLKYMLPRLVGIHEGLTRQGGAGGSMSSKGEGEKKLELDRRKIEQRLNALRRELKEVEGNRATTRKKREQSGIPKVALVGYTNAGKSTIMNRMLGSYSKTPEKTVFEKDMLFATLETSVRIIETGNRKPFYLSDTVGFIHKLPHDLVEAFHSTLEEVCEADLILHVVDYSDEAHREHMQVTNETLKEIGADKVPQLLVFNKVDRLLEQESDRCPERIPYVKKDSIYISAANELGISELAKLIQEKVYSDNQDVCFKIPYDKAKIAALISQGNQVYETTYLEDGIWIRANCHSQDIGKYGIYIVEES